MRLFYQWEKSTIAIVRLFQAEFVKCVKAMLTEGAFARWLNIMNSDYICIETITGQFIDFLNVKYLKMTPEKRLKNLSSIAKRIAEFRSDRDHCGIKEAIDEGTRKLGCKPEELYLEGIEYPEDIEW
jgi:hypothetical protein